MAAMKHGHFASPRRRGGHVLVPSIHIATDGVPDNHFKTTLYARGVCNNKTAYFPNNRCEWPFFPHSDPNEAGEYCHVAGLDPANPKLLNIYSLGETIDGKKFGRTMHMMEFNSHDPGLRDTILVKMDMQGGNLFHLNSFTVYQRQGGLLQDGTFMLEEVDTDDMDLCEIYLKDLHLWSFVTEDYVEFTVGEWSMFNSSNLLDWGAAAREE